MKIAFFGTPEFAVPCLEALVKSGHTVRVVITQPDRPAGRKHEILPTPVKKTAL
jgi:methionyl-tRNA formyltransferase